MIVGGVVAALLGALLLAVGAQDQNRGVRGAASAGGGATDAGFSPRQLLALVRQPRWLLGSALLGLAIGLQLVGLLLAPLPVVQPLGALSLVATALVGARMNRTAVTPAAARAIGLCVVGITLVVLTASFTTSSSPDSVDRVVPVLVLLAVVLVVIGGGFLTLRKRLPAVAFAIAGGVCFGFVATLMKIVLDRCTTAVQHGSLPDPTSPFTTLVGMGALVSGLLGIYLVQTAYSTGSADLVVASLTVVDPIVAVTIGVVLLGEAARAPWWVPVVFIAAGAIAVVGVFRLARHQPQPS